MLDSTHEASIVGSELQFELPETLITSDRWTDTGESTGTFSDGRWTKNSLHEIALRKPGTITPGSLEAIREVVASTIGRWIGVTVPVVQLLQHQDGPCALSMRVGKNVFTWGNVMIDAAGSILRSTALEALTDYGGTFVLDVLVGACDRRNYGNHVFVEDSNTWFTLDYSLSFNRYDRTGVGDAALPYGSGLLAQVYFPEMLDALRRCPAPLLAALTRAEGLKDGDIDRLFAKIPGEYASEGDKRAMAAFLHERKSRLRSLIRTWCGTIGMEEMIKDA